MTCPSKSSLTLVSAQKTAEDRRTPRPFTRLAAHPDSGRSWSAAVPCRFSNGRRLVSAWMLWAVLVASSFLAFRAETAAADGSLNFLVATNGNDSWSGRLAAPNRGHTDGPFATLKKAGESA